MDDLNQARALLEAEGYTCVLCRGQVFHTSRHRGVKPLMDMLGEDLRGFSAADKVVGRATALLYCLLGIRALYAHTVSEDALAVLTAHSIPVTFVHRVPFIQNRAGTGRCPMEEATAGITDPTLAPEAIRRKLKELQG